MRRSSLYVYEQEFPFEQAGHIERRTRAGLVSLVKLADFSDGTILPHEYTLSGRRRTYDHLAVTLLNVGQIFGLLADETGEIFKLIGQMKDEPAAGTGIDKDGVRHSIYPCKDQEIIASIRESAEPGTILIADGPYRDETALLIIMTGKLSRCFPGDDDARLHGGSGTGHPFISPPHQERSWEKQRRFSPGIGPLFPAAELGDAILL